MLFRTAQSPRTTSILDNELFADLSPQASRELLSLGNPLFYPAHATIFAENENVRGIFVMIEGEAKLSINSAEGKRLSLSIARKGEILGLSSTLSGCPYEMTAETLYPSRIAPIGRRELLGFMTRHPQAHQLLMVEMSRQYSLACEQLRTLGLSTSVPERLARLLLHWSEYGERTERGTSIRFSMTHEEVGEFIGASRETVTRTLAAFKSQKLVLFSGSILTIPNMSALAQYAGC
ncbi:MAG TPA: Crp/Fnr family transcriptional regulator [Terracidiphilus sp.]|nr:Crp/Fnr family transcriptional regulator [Terracidiphilus sp.]